MMNKKKIIKYHLIISLPYYNEFLGMNISIHGKYR